LTILAASGVVGLGLFALIAFGLARLHVVLLAPLFISAMTNTFVFSPQSFAVFMLFAGAVYHLKAETASAPARSRRIGGEDLRTALTRPPAPDRVRGSGADSPRASGRSPNHHNHIL